jgi:DNA recombination protein RmuC
MLVTLAILLTLIAAAAVAFSWYDGRAARTALQSQLAALQQSMQSQVQSLDARLTSGVAGVQQSLTASITSTHDTMRSVDQQLGELSASTRQMLEVGRDISGLQQLLRAPKPRGQFGELLLERLLADILPSDHFALQHRFKSGQIVDAVIAIGGGLVPVDAKFPASAFRRIVDAPDDATRGLARRDFARDVRGHIDAVAKYILPDEGTFGFALMYIPAENVYYESMIRDDAGDLQAYAQAKRVIACSPNSFFAYLQALVLGLKGLRVEERSREIVAHLERLNDDFGRFRKDFDTLGNHITHAHTKFDDLDRHADRLADRLARPLDHAQALPDDAEPLRLIE